MPISPFQHWPASERLLISHWSSRWVATETPLATQHLKKIRVKGLSWSPCHAASHAAESSAAALPGGWGEDSEEPNSLSPQPSQQRFSAAWKLNPEVLFRITGKTQALELQAWSLPGESTESVIRPHYMHGVDASGVGFVMVLLHPIQCF